VKQVPYWGLKILGASVQNVVTRRPGDQDLCTPELDENVTFLLHYKQTAEGRKTIISFLFMYLPL
jgi:hypothetical protein